VLDLSSLAISDGRMDPLNTFPWSVAMRWWSSDEPLKENFLINTAKFDSTTATLFEKQRLCVRSIDLTGNDLAEGENKSIGYRRQTSLLTGNNFFMVLLAPNSLFGTFTGTRCIAGNLVFGPALQACRLLDHRHTQYAPSTWGMNPPSGTFQATVRGPRPLNRASTRASEGRLLRQGTVLEDDHVVLIKSRRRRVAGPSSLVETIRLSVLTEIDSEFFWSNRSLKLGQIADAFEVDIPKITRHLRYTELSDSERETTLERAPGDLPPHLWEAFLTSYVCGMCFRLTSSCGRTVHFSTTRIVYTSPHSMDSPVTIVTQACPDCFVRPLPDRGPPR
jgi:hypothetical protein